MLAVFSTTRRSLASLAIAPASACRRARRYRRSVASVGVVGTSSRRTSGSRSSSVIAGLLLRMSFDAPKSERGAGVPSPLLETRLGSAGSTDAGGPDLVHRLLGRCLRHRLYRYEDAALGFGTELHMTVDEREQGVVLAKADILARMPLGAALARNDVAGHDLLPAEQLYAQPLAVRIAAVARGAACFLVCHGIKSLTSGVI